MKIEEVPELTLPIIKPNRDYFCQYCDKVNGSRPPRGVPVGAPPKLVGPCAGLCAGALQSLSTDCCWSLGVFPFRQERAGGVASFSAIIFSSELVDLVLPVVHSVCDFYYKRRVLLARV